MVSVPYWEWDAQPRAQQVAYLEAKVQHGLVGGHKAGPVTIAIPRAAAFT